MTLRNTRRRSSTIMPSTPAPSPHPVCVPAGQDGLTPRELEIRRLLAGGLDNAEIAGEPDSSESTVKNHLTGVFGKLGVRDRAQAVIAAYESCPVAVAVAVEGGGGGA